MRIADAQSAHDMRRIARRRLPRAVFDVIDGGAGDELTLRANCEAFEQLWLRPRAFAEVRDVDLRTTVLGQPLAVPFLLGPCSFARMCDSAAEPAVARAAERAGTAYVVAGGSSAAPERVAQAVEQPLWYQLYMNPDRAVTAALLDRVEAARYRVLCVTIDTPGKPHRERDLRNRIDLPLTITPRLALAGLTRPRWARDFLLGTDGSESPLRAVANAYGNFADAILHIKSVTLDDVAWLRERWPGPLVIKGILRGEDVPPLLGLGVDGVVVSNHGGRNLDGAPPTITVLAEVVAAADGRAEVLLDSGIRRGTDILKALALGARACLVGRPYLFALAAGGEAGVDRMLTLLRNEVHRAMAFAGVASIGAIDRSLVSSHELQEA
jgi:isopentenyl diphosphate isomerase/L-lactate dehydrogenase-like FMN-dependent dehydrogenase